MARAIRFTFPALGASAVAQLLEDDAPKTCESVWSILPVAGTAHHAIYSGSEGVLLLPEVVVVDPENATADVRRGDVGFTWFEGGSSAAAAEAFAEICWFYDDDARPSMPEGDVPVNIFARFTDDAGAFFDACKRMRRLGVQTLLVERVDDPSGGLTVADVQHAVVYRDPHVRVIEVELFAGLAARLTVEPNANLDASTTIDRVSDDGLAWRAADIQGDQPLNHTVTIPGLGDLAVTAEGAHLVASIGDARAVVRALPGDRIDDVFVDLLPDGRVLCVYRCFDGAAPDQVDSTWACYAVSFRIATTEVR